MQLKFSIKSSTHYLGFLRSMMAAAGRLSLGPVFDHKAKVACTLALVEAVNNAIFHAHKRDLNKWIEVAIDVHNSAVSMEVSDSGPGFYMPDIDVPPVDHVHGRGLFIIRSVMDEVKYKRGKKNVLKMVYNL